MRLSDLSIQRPVLSLVINALIVVFGVLAFAELPVRELPAVDPPVVSISTRYPGASAEVVETRITQVIENAVSGIEGIRSIRSTSREAASSVRIEFSLDRPMESAANDVRDRVSRALRALPEEAEVPVVAKVDRDAFPILWGTLSSERLGSLELTDFARRVLIDRITALPGVADVRLSGARDYALRVWLDRGALAARGLTVQDVEEAIRRENAELPAGRIESRQREFTVRTDARLRRPEDFAGIVLVERGGAAVRLAEVARVELGAETTRGAYQADGRTAVGLGVVRQATANTLDVARGVRALFDDLHGTLPADIRLDVSLDDSVFIAESIYQVFHALGIALLLVVLVVFAFLGSPRATLIPAVAIPVSVIASFMALAPLGFSINVLTLLALVLAIGLVVDDAIIVVENISRRIEEGEPPLLAAYRGARQIGFAVIATTAVLVAAVLPLTLLEDTVGRMFKEFAVALAAAVAFSALSALTLAPMLCSQVLRQRRPAGALARLGGRLGRRGLGLYDRLLRGVLGAPVLALFLFAAAAAGAALLFAALPTAFSPPEDRANLRVSVDAPQGSSQAYTEREIAEIQAVLEPYVRSGEIARVLTVLNPGWAGSAGVHRGFLMVRLAPWEARTRSQQQLLAEIRPRLETVPGAHVSAWGPAASAAAARPASSRSCWAAAAGPSWSPGATACSTACAPSPGSGTPAPITTRPSRSCASRSTGRGPPISGCRCRTSARPWRPCWAAARSPASSIAARNTR